MTLKNGCETNVMNMTLHKPYPNHSLMLHNIKFEKRCMNWKRQQIKWGHLVIRLPPYLCQYNQSELIPAVVKSEVAYLNKTFRLSNVETLMNEATDSHYKEVNLINTFLYEFLGLTPDMILTILFCKININLL
jgi:hypothetical protein